MSRKLRALVALALLLLPALPVDVAAQAPPAPPLPGAPGAPGAPTLPGLPGLPDLPEPLARLLTDLFGGAQQGQQLPQQVAPNNQPSVGAAGGFGRDVVADARDEGFELRDECLTSNVPPAVPPACAIRTLFVDGFEGNGSLAGRGWGQEVLQGGAPWGLLDVRDGSVARDSGEAFAPVFEGAQNPLVAKDGRRAVTIVGEDGRYGRRLDARLISPVIDLRHVAGTSASTDDAFLQIINDPNLKDSHQQLVALWRALPSVGELAYLFTTPPSQFNGVPPNGDPLRLSNPVDPSYGAALINLTFYHKYDLRPDRGNEGFRDGLFLEVRRVRDDGTTEPWRHLAGDPVFESTLSERLGLQIGGVSPSGLGEAASTSPPVLGPQEYHPFLSDYNGRVQLLNPARCAGDVTCVASVPAWVQDSDNRLVKSHFTLNAFAGERIQLAWRVHSEGTTGDPHFGWILDAVRVEALLHARDPGVHAVSRPRAGDIVPTDAVIQPEATIRNYGSLPVAGLVVNFTIEEDAPQLTPDNLAAAARADAAALQAAAEAGQAPAAPGARTAALAAGAAAPPKVLMRSNATIPLLGGLEEVVVRSPLACAACVAGAYRLHVEVGTLPVTALAGAEVSADRLEDGGLANNNATNRFEVRDVAAAGLEMRALADALLSDLGEPKVFEVALTNLGNQPLVGSVEVTAEEVDPTSLLPVAGGHRLVLGGVPFGPGDLPVGQRITSFGGAVDTFTGNLTWVPVGLPPGAYRVEAALRAQPVVLPPVADAKAVFIRVTPPPYYTNDFEGQRVAADVRDGLFEPRELAAPIDSLLRISNTGVTDHHVVARRLPEREGWADATEVANATLNRSRFLDVPLDVPATYEIRAGLRDAGTSVDAAPTGMRVRVFFEDHFSPTRPPFAGFESHGFAGIMNNGDTQTIGVTPLPHSTVTVNHTWDAVGTDGALLEASLLRLLGGPPVGFGPVSPTVEPPLALAPGSIVLGPLRVRAEGNAAGASVDLACRVTLPVPVFSGILAPAQAAVAGVPREHDCAQSLATPVPVGSDASVSIAGGALVPPRLVVTGGDADRRIALTAGFLRFAGVTVHPGGSGEAIPIPVVLDQPLGEPRVLCQAPEPACAVPLPEGVYPPGPLPDPVGLGDGFEVPPTLVGSPGSEPVEIPLEGREIVIGEGADLALSVVPGQLTVGRIRLEAGDDPALVIPIHFDAPIPIVTIPFLGTQPVDINDDMGQALAALGGAACDATPACVTDTEVRVDLDGLPGNINLSAVAVHYDSAAVVVPRLVVTCEKDGAARRNYATLTPGSVTLRGGRITGPDGLNVPLLDVTGIATPGARQAIPPPPVPSPTCPQTGSPPLGTYPDPAAVPDINATLDVPPSGDTIVLPPPDLAPNWTDPHEIPPVPVPPQHVVLYTLVQGGLETMGDRLAELMGQDYAWATFGPDGVCLTGKLVTNGRSQLALLPPGTELPPEVVSRVPGEKQLFEGACPPAPGDPEACNVVPTAEPGTLLDPDSPDVLLRTDVFIPYGCLEKQLSPTHSVLHDYYLGQELDLRATACSPPSCRPVLTFWHQNNFSWSGVDTGLALPGAVGGPAGVLGRMQQVSPDQFGDNRSRGMVEVTVLDNGPAVSHAPSPSPGAIAAEAGVALPSACETGAAVCQQACVDPGLAGSAPGTLPLVGATYDEQLRGRAACAMRTVDEPAATPVALASFTEPASRWEPERIDLSAYVGRRIFLAFHLQTSLARQDQLAGRAIYGSHPCVIDTVQGQVQAGSGQPFPSTQADPAVEVGRSVTCEVSDLDPWSLDNIRLVGLRADGAIQELQPECPQEPLEARRAGCGFFDTVGDATIAGEDANRNWTRWLAMRSLREAADANLALAPACYLADLRPLDERSVAADAAEELRRCLAESRFTGPVGMATDGRGWARYRADTPLPAESTADPNPHLDGWFLDETAGFVAPGSPLPDQTTALHWGGPGVGGVYPSGGGYFKDSQKDRSLYAIATTPLLSLASASQPFLEFYTRYTFHGNRLNPEPNPDTYASEVDISNIARDGGTLFLSRYHRDPATGRYLLDRTTHVAPEGGYPAYVSPAGSLTEAQNRYDCIAAQCAGSIDDWVTAPRGDAIRDTLSWETCSNGTVYLLGGLTNFCTSVDLGKVGDKMTGKKLNNAFAGFSPGWIRVSVDLLAGFQALCLKEALTPQGPVIRSHNPVRCAAFDDPDRYACEGIRCENLFTGEVTLNLTSPDRDADGLYALEFHAVNPDVNPGPGFVGRSFGWAVDGLQVKERHLANDIGVSAILDPPPGKPVGPGQQIQLRVNVTNAGYFSQRGFGLRFNVSQEGVQVFPPLGVNASQLLPGCNFQSCGQVVPRSVVVHGHRELEADHNTTLSLETPWIPERSGVYTVTVWTELRDVRSGDVTVPIRDENPVNDIFGMRVDVREDHHVRLLTAEEEPDGQVVRPLVGTAQDARAVRISVLNDGTLPEFTGRDPVTGEARSLTVTLTVVREGSDEPEFTSVQTIDRVGPGRTATRDFTWVPQSGGLYTLTFRVHLSTSSAPDPERVVQVLVLTPLLPRDGQDWASYFVPEGTGWTSDVPGELGEAAAEGAGSAPAPGACGPRGGIGAWRFSRGDRYAPGDQGSVVLCTPLDLTTFRGAVLALEHRYDFEAGYDGGVVEVSADGQRWEKIAPLGGYAGNLSSSSPGVGVGEDVAPDCRVSDLGMPDCQVFTGASDGVITSLFPLGQARTARTDPVVLMRDSFDAGTHLLGAELQDDRPTWTEVVTRAPVPDAGRAWWVDKSLAWAGPLPRTDLTNTTPLDGYKELRTRNFTVPNVAGNLLVEFDDWRALGLVARDGPIPSPTSVEVFLEVWDAGRPRRVSVVGAGVSETNIYGDNYQGWTHRSILIPRTQVERMVDRPVQLVFRLNLANAGSEHGGRINFPTIGDPGGGQPGDTDTVAPNLGWAIAHPKLTLLAASAACKAARLEGCVVLDRPLDYPSPDSARVREEWTGAWGTRRLNPFTQQVDTLLGSRGEDPEALQQAGWTLVEATGDAGRKPVWDLQALAPAHTGHGRVAEARGQGVGARLVAPLSLRAAVGNVSLALDHSFKFADINRRAFGSDILGGASGGRVEVSRDGGVTWEPVAPAAVFAEGAWQALADPDAPDPVTYTLGDGPNARGGAASTVNYGLPYVGYRRMFVGEPVVSCRTITLPYCMQPSDPDALPFNWTAAAAEGPWQPRLDLSAHTPLGGRARDAEGDSDFGVGGSAFTGTSCVDRDSDFAFRYEDAVCRSPAGWQRVRFDLSRYAGQDVLLGFHAWFTSHRSAGGDDTTQEDFWRIDNLEVEGPVLDGKPLYVRLRAFSDRSGEGAGWEVLNATILGDEHVRNLGVRIQRPAAGAPLNQEDTVEARVVNKGQLPVRGTGVVVVEQAGAPAIENPDFEATDAVLEGWRYGRTGGPVPLAAFVDTSAPAEREQALKLSNPAPAAVTGLADAGSNATTMVDAARTETAEDHWAGYVLRFNNGANDGLSRGIVDFDPANDTITVQPAFPSAIAAEDPYQIEHPPRLYQEILVPPGDWQITGLADVENLGLQLVSSGAGALLAGDFDHDGTEDRISVEFAGEHGAMANPATGVRYARFYLNFTERGRPEGDLVNLTLTTDPDLFGGEEFRGTVRIDHLEIVPWVEAGGDAALQALVNPGCEGPLGPGDRGDGWVALAGQVACVPASTTAGRQVRIAEGANALQVQGTLDEPSFELVQNLTLPAGSYRLRGTAGSLHLPGSPEWPGNATRTVAVDHGNGTAFPLNATADPALVQFVALPPGEHEVLQVNASVRVLPSDVPLGELRAQVLDAQGGPLGEERLVELSGALRAERETSPGAEASDDTYVTSSLNAPVSLTFQLTDPVGEVHGVRSVVVKVEASVRPNADAPIDDQFSVRACLSGASQSCGAPTPFAASGQDVVLSADVTHGEFRPNTAVDTPTSWSQEDLKFLNIEVLPVRVGARDGTWRIDAVWLELDYEADVTFNFTSARDVAGAGVVGLGFRRVLLPMAMLGGPDERRVTLEEPLGHRQDGYLAARDAELGALVSVEEPREEGAIGQDLAVEVVVAREGRVVLDVVGAEPSPGPVVLTQPTPALPSDRNIPFALDLVVPGNGTVQVRARAEDWRGILTLDALRIEPRSLAAQNFSAALDPGASRAVALPFQPKEGFTYHIRAAVRPLDAVDGRAGEPLLGDNVVVRTTIPSLGPGRLRIAQVEAVPNNVNLGLGQPVELRMVVENPGSTEAEIRDLEVVIADARDNTVFRGGPSDLEPPPETLTVEPQGRAAFTWLFFPPATMPQGVYKLKGAVFQVGDVAVAPAQARLYLGTNFHEQFGYTWPFFNATTIDDPPGQPQGELFDLPEELFRERWTSNGFWDDSAEAGGCIFEPGDETTFVCVNPGGDGNADPHQAVTYPSCNWVFVKTGPPNNNSASRALSIGSDPDNDAVFPQVDPTMQAWGCPLDNSVPARGTILAMLRSPVINITGMGDPRVIFADKHSMGRDVFGDVFVRLLNADGTKTFPADEKPCSSALNGLKSDRFAVDPNVAVGEKVEGWIPLTGLEDFPRSPRLDGDTLNFRQNKWVARNIGVRGPVELAASRTGVQLDFEAWPFAQFCWRVTQPSPAAGAGQLVEWSIDDVLVTPYGMHLGPVQRAPIGDNVTKDYRFLVGNDGAYTDTYTVRLLDENGLPSRGPSFWTAEAVDESGAPLREIRLQPGEQRVVTVRVQVGVAPPTSAREGTVDLAVTVVSTTNPVLRSTQHLHLDFRYPERPNARIAGLIVNDAGLSVDKPRTVDVLVQNTGATPLEGMSVVVVDKMDASFGVAPEELRRIDGSPLPPLDLAPGEVRVLTVNWIPRVPGEHNLTAIADPSDRLLEFDERDNVFVRPLAIRAAEFPDLRVEVAVSKESPLPGEEVGVEVRIANLGAAAAEAVQLSVRAGVTDLLPGESPHILPHAIFPGATTVVNATWRPAFPGEQTIIVRAKTLAGVLERIDTSGDNVQVLAIQVRSRGLEVAGPGAGLQVAAGATASATLEVRNRGDLDDTYALTVVPPDGWRVEFQGFGESARIRVGNRSSVNVTLVVGPPALAEAGPYEVLVRAASEHGTDAAQASVVATIPQEFGVRFRLEPEMLLQPGPRALPLRLENGGNGADLVTVRARSLPAAWSVEPTSFDLPALARLTRAVNLSIPTSTPEGAYRLVLEAQGKGGELLAQEVLVQVLPLELLQLEIAGVPAQLGVGQALAGAVVVRNAGNLPARADVRFAVEPAGALPSLPPGAPDPAALLAAHPARLDRDVVSMGPGEVRTLPWSFVVPANVTRGALAFRAEAGSGRGAAYASVAQAVVVGSDLAVADVELLPRGVVRDGATATLSARIVNRGALPAPASLAVYVDDQLVAYEPGEALAPGAETKVQASFRAQAGEHVVLVVVDPGKQVAEEDEANNARLAVQHVERPAGVFAVPGLEVWTAMVAVAAVAWAGRRVRR